MKLDPIVRAHRRSRGQNAPGRRARTAALCIALAGLAWLGGCLDGAGPNKLLPSPPQGLVVSDPVVAPAASAPPVGTLSVAAAEGDSVVYVSLISGTAPEGANATVRNLTSGFAVTTPVLDGGFDPVSVSAQFGDTLEIQVRDLSDVVVLEARVAVPAARPPVVVRTEPPPRKRDVPLNSVIVVVFSEPMDPVSLDTASILLLRGSSPVGGAVMLRAGSGLVAEFTPEPPLEAQSAYRLVVTRGVRDLVGDSLEATVQVDFTTERAPPPPLLLAAVSAGGEHTCGLTTDGVAYCWGLGASGQLGNGTTAFSATPMPVSGGLTFTSISAGGDFTCGLTGSAAYCWGSNFVGQLGNGSKTSSTIPVSVFGSLTFTSLEAGWHHACAVTTGGAAYCWGFNRAGGVGDTSGAELCVDESFTTNPSPCNTTPKVVAGGLVFASVSPGWLHTCGITAVGQAYCWGYNGRGQLGNGDTTDAYGPVAVAGGLTLASVDAGDLHTCGVAAGGAAYCWGSNLAGELGTQGTGSVDERRPGLVYGGHSFASVTAGFLYTCAVASSGVGYCWGNGATGALGNGSLDDRGIPVPVSDVSSFTTVSASRNASYPLHTCGLTRSSEVYCWGQNDSGQLGDGTQTQSTVPVRVPSP